MDKKTRRVVSLVLFLIGVFFIFNSRANITGSVVGTYFPNSIWSLVGGILIISSLVVLILQTLEEKMNGNYTTYYHDRVREITKNSKDVWVSRWELPGLEKEFEKVDIKVRGPESHSGGLTGPTQKHLNLDGRNYNGVKLKHKHVFITNDPYDQRLYGLNKTNSKTKGKSSYDFKSKVYYPNHPRKYYQLT